MEDTRYDFETDQAAVTVKPKNGSTLKKILGYVALATVVAGVVMNFPDIRRYIRISRM